MSQTVMTTATKRVLNGVALATLWPAGAAGALAADPPTEPTYTNSLGMVLARFEPGTFAMGVGTDLRIQDIAGGVDWDEQPAHSVTLTAPFYVLTGRVTKAQFDLAGLGTAPASGRVSWDRASAFCDWLSQKEGRSYRLLTEAEWEYVCRNPGNVGDFGSEWVADWHGGYRNVSLTNPAGPATGVLKVLRSDVANRLSLAPSVEGKGIFRVVMDTAPTDRFVHAPLPFNQMGVKQGTAPALQGPNAAVPYFTARFAMPIPPDNDRQLNASLLGLDPAVQDHNHSPGLEIMPNGDVLAIWFTGPKGTEYGPKMRNVQARLRYGAEEFDMPELMIHVKGEQSIAALQWREGTTNWLFTGGNSTFRVSRSLDSGATWTMVSPYPTGGYTQPITSAFRAPDGAMYVATDGDGNGSCLWRSLDNGLTWSDQGGQTSGRHSTIVPLDGTGRLLSLAGKNTEINGYMPQNISTDWGKTWQAPTQSPFPKLGGNQRPSMIRLASGKLAVVGDATLVGSTTPPAGWPHGTAPYVALSADNGATWHFKALPVALKHEGGPHLTLGYAVVRQAPNGVIHVLTTMTQPCIHYEFNEAWVYSAAGDIQPETSGGSITNYSENYPGAALKATWSARICPNGRYLLDGVETHYYEDGKKQWEVTWASGRRTGEETLWAPNGDKFWSWSHNLANNVSTWTHWWSNGQKRLESQWNANPVARDLPARHFRGLVADGTAKNWDSTGRLVSSCVFANGKLTSENTVPSITFQPAAVSVTAGLSATFNVTATGSVPLAYQWCRNGVAIGGATGTCYTLAATTINDRSAAFTVTVTNAYGSVTSSVAMLTVNTVVTCAIASPTNGATVTAGTTVPITVSAATSHGAITNVEFSVDGVKIGSDATAPYTCDWNPVQPGAVGTRVITAKAFDRFTSTNAAPVTVTVLSRVTCAITAPTSQTVVKAGTNVTLTAAASSLDAGINLVDFFANGVKIGTGVSPSLAGVWQNVQVGTHAITAVATDRLGQTSPVSAPITISVTASGAWEPVMALGGTIKDYTLNGRKYRAHIFDTVGTTSLNVSVGGNVEVLVVAGGGGGGSGDNNGDGGGGGGGAGGLVYTNRTLVPGNYTVTVGAGGQGRMSMSGKGSNSVFGSLVALGGGGVRRGVVDLATQDDGGSGGGMFGRSDYTPGTGTQTDSASGGYGNNGGYGDTTPGNQGGGGGGGAGSVGGNAPANGNGGNGGDGISYDLSGTLTGYAGGGGGGAKSGRTAGTATAGGGAGGVGTHGGFNAAANSGGGGGGAGTLGAAANGKGGNGGSGIVIVRYANRRFHPFPM